MALKDSLTFVLGVFISFFDRVRDSFPTLGTSDCKCHLCFEAWLIEHWEYMITMECFKLRVEVLLLVGSVNIWMKTNSVCVVNIEVADLDSVPSKSDVCFFQFYSLISIYRATRNSLVIDWEIGYCNSLEVNKEFPISWHFDKVEVHYRFADVVMSFVECELEIIFNFRYQFITLFSFSLLKCDILIVAWVKCNNVTKVFSNESSDFRWGDVSRGLWFYHSGRCGVKIKIIFWLLFS
jgi:hypothetical protein